MVKKKKSKSKLYSSGNLLFLAQKALHRCEVDNDEAQVVVILICSAVECAVNDYVGMISSWADESDPKISVFLDIMNELNDENAAVKKRLRMASFVLNGEKLDFGCGPFEDYFQLINLRNALIHRHPDPVIPKDMVKDFDDVRGNKIVNYLIGRGIYSTHQADFSSPSISDLAHSEPVAKWAFQTGLNVLKEIEKIFAPSIPYPISIFDYDKLETV